MFNKGKNMQIRKNMMIRKHILNSWPHVWPVYLPHHLKYCQWIHKSLVTNFLSCLDAASPPHHPIKPQGKKKKKPATKSVVPLGQHDTLGRVGGHAKPTIPSTSAPLSMLWWAVRRGDWYSASWSGYIFGYIFLSFLCFFHFSFHAFFFSILQDECDFLFIFPKWI